MAGHWRTPVARQQVYSTDLKVLGVLHTVSFCMWQMQFNREYLLLVDSQGVGGQLLPAGGSQSQVAAKACSIHRELSTPCWLHGQQICRDNALLRGDSGQNLLPLKTFVVKLVYTLLTANGFLSKQIKDGSEKVQFFNTLPPVLDDFPPAVCKHKILPQLLNAFEYGSAGSAILMPLFKVLFLGSCITMPRRMSMCDGCVDVWWMQSVSVWWMWSVHLVSSVYLLFNICDLSPVVLPLSGCWPTCLYFQRIFVCLVEQPKTLPIVSTQISCTTLTQGNDALKCTWMETFSSSEAIYWFQFWFHCWMRSLFIHCLHCSWTNQLKYLETPCQK